MHKLIFTAYRFNIKLSVKYIGVTLGIVSPVIYDTAIQKVIQVINHGLCV